MRSNVTDGTINTRRAVTALIAVIAVAAGCTPPPAQGPSPNDAPRAGEAAYVESGPYAVGVTTVQLSDRPLEIWYPVDPEEVGDAARDEYFIRDFVSSSIDALIPEDINPEFVTDAYRDLPATDDGPFPLVLFSHGFASYRTQSTFLTTHLASWGFVVISPDYLERGLRAVLGEPPPASRSDVAVANEAIEFARAATVTSGGPLEGVVDGAQVLPIGHSAGGGTTLRLLARPDVPAGIPLAAGLNITQLLDAMRLLPADTAVTWIAAPRDGIVRIDDVRRGYDFTAGERRLVELNDAGHVNAFSDICEIGEGGVVEIAQGANLPIPPQLLALGDDGCQVPRFKPSPELWEEVRHFTTAELRYRAGLDPEPVGLGDQVLEQFDDVRRYRHDP